MGEVVTTEKTVNRFGAWLLREAARRDMSLPQIATLANMQTSTLYRIATRPDGEPRIATLYTLAQALGLPLWQVVEACGYDIGIERNAA